MKLALTDARVLAWTVAYVREHGYPPTLREIAVGVGLSSTSSVSYQLRRLEHAGYLAVTPNTSRGIKLLPKTGFLSHAMDTMRQGT